MKGKSHTAFQYLVIFLHIVHMEPWWLVNVSASGIHRRARGAKQEALFHPHPWLFILIKWFSSTGKGQRAINHDNTAPWGHEALCLEETPLLWCGCTSLGLRNNRGKGLGLLKAESFWWEGKLKPQDLKRAIKVMLGNVRPMDTHQGLTHVAGGNLLLGLVHFPHDWRLTVQEPGLTFNSIKMLLHLLNCLCRTYFSLFLTTQGNGTRNYILLGWLFVNACISH